MSEMKNPFDALADLGSDDGAENPFTLFKDLTDLDDENPFDTLKDEKVSQNEAEPIELSLMISDETTSEPASDSQEEAESTNTTTSNSDENTAPAHNADISNDAVADTDDEPPNPLMAVLEQQEQQSLFVKRPVFKYGSAEEEIMDTEQTFEDLRAAKSQDFPELEDANRVTWIVT